MLTCNYYFEDAARTNKFLERCKLILQCLRATPGRFGAGDKYPIHPTIIYTSPNPNSLSLGFGISLKGRHFKGSVHCLSLTMTTIDDGWVNSLSRSSKYRNTQMNADAMSGSSHLSIHPSQTH